MRSDRRRFRVQGRLSALLLFALSGAVFASETPAPKDKEPFVEVPTGVIVPASRAQNEAEPCLVDCSETYWTPSPEMITQLETGLRPYIEERLRETLSALEALPIEKRPGSMQESMSRHFRNILGRLDQTARQYVGVVVAEKRWIHVAGMPRIERYLWAERILIISDGGDWFWEATYRLDSGFVGFGWHGEA